MKTRTTHAACAELADRSGQIRQPTLEPKSHWQVRLFTYFGFASGRAMSSASPILAAFGYGSRPTYVPQLAEVFRGPPGIISVASQMVSSGPTAAAE